MKPGEYKIVAHLMNEYPKGLTFTELKEKTGLSAPSLNEYRVSLLKDGMILYNPATRQYSVAAAYHPTEKVSTHLKRNLSYLLSDMPFEGSRIAMVKDVELRKRIFISFLSYHLSNVSVLVLAAISDALDQTLGQNKKAKYVVEEKLESGKKDKTKEVKAFFNYWEGELSQFHSVMNDRMQNWIIPYIQMMALADFGNADLGMKRIIEELTKRFSPEAEETTLWFRELEALDHEFASKNPEFAELKRQADDLRRERAYAHENEKKE
ncbi:MAG: hypothetical protein ABSG57_04795 [Candidatus Bathyarchaeia archaeon]